MKKIFSLIFIVVLFGACNNSSKNQEEKITQAKKDEAKTFHQEIGNYFTPITNDFNSIISLNKEVTNNAVNGTLFKPEIDNLEAEINKLLLKIDENITGINNLIEFDEEIKLKETILNYLLTIKLLLQNDFREYIVLIQQEMTDENKTKCGDVVMQIYEKVNKHEKLKTEVEKTFFEKYLT